MCAVSSAARAHGSPHHHNEKDSSSFSPGSRLSNLVLDRAVRGGVAADIQSCGISHVV